jgi:hypothetical protein
LLLHGGRPQGDCLTPTPPWHGHDHRAFAWSAQRIAGRQKGRALGHPFRSHGGICARLSEQVAKGVPRQMRTLGEKEVFSRCASPSILLLAVRQPLRTPHCGRCVWERQGGETGRQAGLLRSRCTPCATSASVLLPMQPLNNTLLPYCPGACSRAPWAPRSPAGQHHSPSLVS